MTQSEPYQLNKETLEALLLTHSTRQIQRIFNLSSSSSVPFYMKKWGLKVPEDRKHKTYPPINIKLMVQEAENGMTAKEMHEKYGWCMDSIFNHYRKIGHPETPRDKIRLQDPTEEQKQLVIGSMLGDGSIRPSGTFVMAQGWKQREYLTWKVNLMSPYMYPVKQSERFDERINKTSISCFSYSQTHPYFMEMRQKFYPQGKKIFPELAQLSPFTLAIWYMDDGTLNRPAKSLVLCTQSFTEEHNKQIQEMLLNQYNLAAVVHREKGGNYFLSMGRAASSDFFNLVEPYMHPSMLYKIGK